MATTSWTAAYAMVAGATDVAVLAPHEMTHPSEYELRPGDINRLKTADLIIYAGYEVMVNQMTTGLDIPHEKMLRISTSYNYDEIRESVLMIAEKTGNEQTALKNLEEIKLLFEKGRMVVMENGLNKKPALVHFFQQSLMEELGINVVAVFGPAHPEPRQIVSLSKTNAFLIVDNSHNPVAGPVREILKEADYIMLLNFPGLYNTRTLADVLRYNIDMLANSSLR